MSLMDADTSAIADRVRGVAAENRVSQERIASILNLSRQTVNQRYSAKVPFTGVELYRIATHLGVDIKRFFPSQTNITPSSAKPGDAA